MLCRCWLSAGVCWWSVGTLTLTTHSNTQTCFLSLRGLCIFFIWWEPVENAGYIKVFYPLQCDIYKNIETKANLLILKEEPLFQVYNWLATRTVLLLTHYWICYVATLVANCVNLFVRSFCSQTPLSSLSCLLRQWHSFFFFVVIQFNGLCRIVSTRYTKAVCPSLEQSQNQELCTY